LFPKSILQDRAVIEWRPFHRLDEDKPPDSILNERKRVKNPTIQPVKGIKSGPIVLLAIIEQSGNGLLK
jgi:hypothetical protein